MKYLWLIALALVTACTLATKGSASGQAYAREVRFQVEPEVIQPRVFRLGMNLGTWTSWGAEQLMRNVLKNPGFEGIVDRAIVIVAEAGSGTFSDDTDWLVRADGFWNGATFEVRTGVSTGARGQVARSVGGTFTSVQPLPRLERGDVIAVTKISDTEPVTQWWTSAGQNGSVVPELDHRPGSDGVRVMHLRGPSTLISYLDAIGDRAGKMLPVEGSWRLTFWSRGSAGSGTLGVRVARQNNTFLSTEIVPGKSWKPYRFEFTAQDIGTGTLELKFEAHEMADILVDDVFLGPAGDFPFRDEVVETLETLRPSYLRDWQGQLGDTLDNRFASSSARRASRYRPGDASQTDYMYSIPELFELCRRVRANPWVVIPTTFSDDELQELGRRLASERFDDVILEFGNEQWNPLFRPAGIPNHVTHAAAASRAFRLIEQAAGRRISFRTVVNAQYANPTTAQETAALASADGTALAPYFLNDLPGGMPPPDAFRLLFQRPDGGWPVTPGKELLVYEVNLHTTGGSAPPSERTAVTAGSVSAPGLAFQILEGVKAGTVRQCVYTLAGFDNRLQDGSFVPLWGITRDLSGRDRFRPTGLAVQLLNQALRGEALAVTGEGEGIHLYAFREGQSYRLAVVSQRDVPARVVVEFPRGERLPSRLMGLSADYPGATNEMETHVRITQGDVKVQGRLAEFDLPEYGMAVLLPREEK